MARISNEEILENLAIHRIRTCQLEFFGHIRKKEGLDSLTLTGHIEAKRDRRRVYLTCECSVEQRAENCTQGETLLRVRRHKKLQKVMASHVLQKDSNYKKNTQTLVDRDKI